MATLSSKVSPSGVATAAQGTLADSAVQPNDSPTFAGLTVDTDTLYVDATGNRVGIGTSNPSSPLHIYNSSPFIRLTDADLDTRHALIGGQNGNLTIDIDPNQTAAASFFSVDIDSTQRMHIDSSGTVTATAFAGDGSGLTGIATGAGSVEAWVNFSGSGTVTIRASGNVSSISDLGTGRFRSNFSASIADASFAVSSDSNFDDGALSSTRIDGAGSTSSIIVEVMRESNGATAFRDATYAYTMVTR